MSRTAMAAGGSGYHHHPGGEEEYEDDRAVRLRCTDKASLKVLLRWYACKKFSHQDRRYIDTYKWEDQNSDFDPRVFQAFIWAEKT
mmetsp:Transcript_6686/g.9938  ORF Transcript_6686/g.9938 Transcript_6686/m.9938 type:complete len:86 (+) Transcript_6686:117-374(+)